MTTTERLLAEGARYAGQEGVRPGGAVDAVDGIQPRLVASPGSREALVSLLAWASSSGLSVRVRGGGTKLSWGGPGRPIDVLLSMAGLGRVVDHRAGDLTATVEGGARLDAVNEVLAAHGQWLALDPPWSDRATIGGIVATNDSGPGRLASGAPRDAIIGVTVARPDGVLAKAGGVVVKNVAGYDLSRLVTGSFGALAVVVDATFKLSPRAPSSRTVRLDAQRVEDLEAPLVAVTTSALTPSAVELAWPPASLLVRFEGVRPAVESQAAELGRLVGRFGSLAILDGDDERTTWTAYRRRWDELGTLLKVSMLPRAVVPTLAWLRDAATAAGLELSAQGRGSLGVLDVRVNGSVEAQVALIERLRRRFSPGDGSAVIRRGDVTLRQRVDPWGPLGDAASVMRAVKRRFDPGGVLNPGTGPV